MATAANALVIMTKAPEPGQVKTRLVPPLSFADAAGLAEALLRDQIDSLAKFGNASLFITYAPESARAYFAEFTRLGFALFPQQGVDLGARMRHAFEHLFDLGYHQVVLIGSDLPTFEHATLQTAFDTMNQGAEVVLAPTEDGGYCLIAMRRPLFDVFQGMAWSRNDVLARTIKTLVGLAARYELLKTSYDIDTWDDVLRLHSDCENGHLGMGHTATLLRRLRSQGIL